MIKAFFFCIKFVVRFSFISIILAALLLGGYLSFWCENNSLMEDLKNPIVQKLKDDNFEELRVGKIKENWGIYYSTIEIDYILLKKDKTKIHLSNIEIEIKTIDSILSKELLVNTLGIESIKIESENILKENKSDKDLNIENYTKIKKYINNLDIMNLDIKDIRIISKKENIDLKDISIKKEKNNNILNISYNEKINIALNYKLKEKNILLDSKIKSNNYYFKKILELSGNKKLLDLIYFDSIYTVIGDLESNILFNYNIVEKKINDYNVKVKLNGNKVILKAYDQITLTNAIGELYYNKKGFYSNKIKGNLDKKKSILEISQKNNENITFDFETSADIEKLSKIANFPLDKILKGQDSFSGSYELNFNKEDKLTVKSSFNDINYKSKIKLKNKNGFNLTGYFDYENDRMNFDINQGTHNIKLNFVNDNFYNVSVGINQKLNRIQKDKGFFITGSLENIEIFELFNYLEEVNSDFSNYDKEIDKDFNTDINLSLLKTKFETQVYDEINFSYLNKIISLTINEDKASGYLYFNQATNEIDLMLDQIKIIPDDAKNIINTKIDKDKAIKDISNIDYVSLFENKYKLNIEIKDLYTEGSQNSHTFTANGEIGNGLFKLDRISITDKENNFKIKSKYLFDAKNNISKLQKINDKETFIEITNIKRLQEISGFEGEKIEIENIKIDGNLSWIGFKPLQMGKTLTGSLSIDISKGYIPKNFTGVGLLKTINLFNFDSWVKMFTFNFEEIESGLHFNSIKGGFEVDKNVVNFSPRIILDSDLFILEFKGYIDYIDSQYDIEIDAIVPLLNKAPAIALFAGLAPEVVGVIWIVDKLAGDFISETFTRTNFNVSGDFNNPIYTKKESQLYNKTEAKKE